MRLRRLSRSPLFFWFVVAVLALLTAGVVGRLVGRARADAARFGSLRTAAVASRPLDLGAVVRASDLELRTVPAAFLPEGWVASADEAVGRTVIAPVGRGEPVLRADLAPWGLRGVAALLPPGGRAVAVPTGAASPVVHAGDVVDVLATFDAREAAGGDPTFAVAVGALVLDAGAEAATVAVTTAEASKVAYAVAHGAVSLAVTAGPPAAAGGTPATTFVPRAPAGTTTTTTRPGGR